MSPEPTHVLLSVLAGHARERNRKLEWGQHQRPFSVGCEGDWAVSAPGVAGVHLYLAFRDSRLCVAAASEEAKVSSGGVRLPETWSELPLPAELRFGEARLRARAVLSSRESLARTRQVDLKQLAPLLKASRSQASPKATARAATPAALLETVCDGGALQRHAEQLLAEARARAAAHFGGKPGTSEPVEPSRPALAPPDPVAFATTQAAAASARAEHSIGSRLRELRSALEGYRALASRRWNQLRALPAFAALAAHTTPRLRLAAGGALALMLALTFAARLATRQSEPELASANLPAAEQQQTAAPAPQASVAGEPPPSSDPAPLVTDLESQRAALQPEPALPPSPELQREAFRAALGGDGAAAAALYQQLASGSGERVFQLAARYAEQGRVRRP